MVAISEEVQDFLRSIYLREIADGNINTPIYVKCVDTLSKLDNPIYGYLRKKPSYPSWIRAGMYMTTVNGYDFGYYWNEQEQFVDVVEVFGNISESIQRIISLTERIENL